MLNSTQTDKEFVLEQKLYIINQLITLIKDQNISVIKNMSKENKDTQLKLLNIRTEILKIEDKLEDILNVNNVNSVNEIKNTVAQFLNLINEEKTAYSIMYQCEQKNDNQVNFNSEIKRENTDSNPEDTEEKKIRESFEKMIDQENRAYYDAIKNEEGYPDNYDDYSEVASDDENIAYQDFLDWRYEDYEKLYKEFYALVNSENVKSWRKKDFEKYMRLREEDSVKVTFCDDKKGNMRIYSKYKFFGLIKNHEYEPDKKLLSKRQLPTEVFTYLISNNIIKEKDFKIFSKNQFGRTFESKMGDILTENELPKEPGRQKRYNKIDFSKFKQSEYKGVLYISNQWSEDSIFKFIKYMRKHYNNQIMIIDPHKQLVEDIKTNKIKANIVSEHWHYDKNDELDEIEYKVNSEDN